jgi:hypothetical protein
MQGRSSIGLRISTSSYGGFRFRGGSASKGGEEVLKKLDEDKAEAGERERKDDLLFQVVRYLYRSQGPSLTTFGS